VKNRASRVLCCTLDSNQDITSSNMKLVTAPTQLSGCTSQTSTVPKLLSAHLDGVVDSTHLSFCICIMCFAVFGIRWILAPAGWWKSRIRYIHSLIAYLALLSPYYLCVCAPRLQELTQFHFLWKVTELQLHSMFWLAHYKCTILWPMML